MQRLNLFPTNKAEVRLSPYLPIRLHFLNVKILQFWQFIDHIDGRYNVPILLQPFNQFTVSTELTESSGAF